jgi:transcriptional regulator with XRE-family HTH domain
MQSGLHDEGHDGRSFEPDQSPPGTAQWSEEHGARLQQARDEAGMTQQEVEQRLGYTTRSVTRWENAKSSPDFGTVQRLADLFGVSLDWLAGRTPFRPVFKPDTVLVNSRAKAVLEELLQQGKGWDDVPDGLRRHPGIDYLFAMPDEVMVMRRDAAERLDAQVQALWKQLGRKR